MRVLEEARRVDRYGIVHDDDMSFQSFESFEKHEKENNNNKEEEEEVEECREDPDEDQGGLYGFLCAGDSICNPWDQIVWNRKEECTDPEISKDSTRDGKSDHDELYRNNEEPVLFYPKKTNENSIHRNNKGLNNIHRNNKGLKGKVKNFLKEGSFRWRKGKRVDSTNNKNQERKKGGIRKKKKKTQAEF